MISFPLKMCDMKVFVDTDADVRLARRLRRDISQRGRDLEGVLKQYSKHVQPAFYYYIAPLMVHADIIVPRGGDNEVAIELIVQHVHTQLQLVSCQFFFFILIPNHYRCYRLLLLVLERFQVEGKTGALVHRSAFALVIVLTSEHAADKRPSYVYTQQRNVQRRIYFLFQAINSLGHRICVVSVTF